MSDESPQAPAPLPIEVPPFLVRDLGLGSVQWIYRFANGYGASVINDGYGSDRGLYELRVIRFYDDQTWTGTKDTPITNDVLGWLKVADVAQTLVQIAALPRKEHS